MKIDGGFFPWKNIEKRLKKYKNLAINDWNNLTKYKPYEYKSFTDLENQLNLITIWFIYIK